MNVNIVVALWRGKQYACTKFRRFASQKGKFWYNKKKKFVFVFSKLFIDMVLKEICTF